MKIAKDLYSIKNEFSVYDKLIRGDESLSKKAFKIRDVLMTVIYPFFADFSSKNVYVDIQPYYERVAIDFETIQIAFYHIIENTAKYVMPNTDVSITFPKDNETQKVVFEMQSFYIDILERQKVILEGFSGKQAMDIGQNAEGIGLYRTKKLVEMNKGSLTVDAGDDIVENVMYCMQQTVLLFLFH